MKKIMLKDLAKVVRSKNAGPFEITMDIIFEKKEDYERVLASGAIDRALISRIYHVREDEIVTLTPFDAVNAIKITIPRKNKQGSFGERDMHAAQQYIPLLYVEVPAP